jgi:hypothetical protein
MSGACWHCCCSDVHNFTCHVLIYQAWTRRSAARVTAQDARRAGTPPARNWNIKRYCIW